MRRVDHVLQRYAETEGRATHTALHRVWAPLGVWGALAVLWSLSPVLAYGAAGALLLYYAALSVPLAMAALALLAVVVYPLVVLGEHAWLAGCVAVVGAGLGLGAVHAKAAGPPSIVAAARSLLLEPLWLLARLFGVLGIPY